MVLNKVTEKMVKILSIYSQPSEITNLVEPRDLNGRSCMFYFAKYNLFQLMETKIMNQYLISRWEGNVTVNASVYQQSTISELLFNKYGVIKRGYIYQNIWDSITNIDK